MYISIYLYMYICIYVYMYSIIGDYAKINMNRSSPEFYSKYELSEDDRQILTKYRSGSHYLKIVTGSYYRTPVEQRTCKCKDIQTLQHVIFQCALTQHIRYETFPTNLQSFFANETLAAKKLREIEKLLSLR